MVREIKKDSRTYYSCEFCGLAYKERKWAEKCQKWCKEHNSCNLEIIKYAVEI